MLVLDLAAHSAVNRVLAQGAALSAKTKLFISHSSHDDGALKRLTALCDALDDYDVLVDKEMIKSGDDWRRTIHCALAECHAAVILFDAEALASPWVLKEATILAWRRDLEGDDFTLLPVALMDDVKALDAGNYGPTLINSTQHVPRGSVEQIAAAIRKVVAPDLVHPTLFGFLTDAIADELEGLPGERLLAQVAANRLNGLPTAPGKNTKVCFAEALARHIFRTGPGSLAEAVGVLEGFGKTLEERIARSILKTLEPMWVEEDAAAVLADARHQTLALYSRDKKLFAQFTGESYATRCYPPWHRRPIVVRVDEGNAGDRVAHVRRCLRVQLGDLPGLDIFADEALDAEIQLLPEPIVVLLPFIVDEDELEALTSKDRGYPNAKFLMFSDKPAAGDIELPKGVHRIKPELTPEIEIDAYRAYGRAQRLIGSLV